MTSIIGDQLRGHPFT